jgi:hypothetical protein
MPTRLLRLVVPALTLTLFAVACGRDEDRVALPALEQNDAGSSPDANVPPGPRGSLASPYEVSGTRLEPAYVDEVAEDGAVVRRLAGWFDKTLGEYCTPSPGRRRTSPKDGRVARYAV